MSRQPSPYKWTCAHCGVGLVPSLPWRCPECDRLLTVAVSKKPKKETNNKK
jgi:rubrerythrin